PGSDELPVLDRIEGLLPVDTRLAACTNQRDAKDEVVVLQNVLDFKPARWLDDLEYVGVGVIRPIGSVHDEAPRFTGSQIECLEGAGESVRPPPASQALGLRKRAEHLLGRCVDEP